MSIQAQRLDHVLIDRWGTDEYQVVGMDVQHYDVINVTRGTTKREQIYKALCRITPAMALANRQRRIDRASKIGMPQVR